MWKKKAGVTTKARCAWCHQLLRLNKKPPHVGEDKKLFCEPECELVARDYANKFRADY